MRSAAATVRRLSTAETLTSASPPAPAVAVAADGAGELPLYRRLSALGGAPEGSLKRAMNKWLREGKAVREREIVSCVRGLHKFGRFRHALELMEWMDTRGMNMSYSNHALRMHLLSKAKGIDFAEEYFNKLPEPAKNHLTCGALLNIYCSEKMADKAIALYEKMKQLNYDHNTLVYNNIMSLFLKIGQPEKVPSLLEEMKVKKVRRDGFSYNILITSYSSLGKIEAIDSVLEEIKMEGTSLSTWHVYSNLASIYISAGHVDKALSSLKSLEETMDANDRSAFHHLISLFARIGNLEEVERLWKSLKAVMKTTNMSYLIMFQALHKLDDFDALQKCFLEWDSSYETYDIRLANIMIGAYLQRGMVMEAESLCDSAAGKGAEPDHRTFQLFINYFLGNHEYNSALMYFEAAVSKLKVWKPDKAMVDEFVRHFEETGDVAHAEAFCKSLKKLGALDSKDYDVLLQTYLNVNENNPPLHHQIEEDKNGESCETAKLLEKAFSSAHQPLTS